MREMTEEEKAADANNKRKKVLNALKEARAKSVTQSAQDQSAVLTQRILHRGCNVSAEKLELVFTRLIVEGSTPSGAHLPPSVYDVKSVQHSTSLAVTDSNAIGMHKDCQRAKKAAWRLRAVPGSEPGRYTLQDDNSGRYLTAEGGGATASEKETPAGVLILKTVPGLASPTSVFTVQEKATDLYLTAGKEADDRVSFQSENGRSTQLWNFVDSDPASAALAKANKARPIVNAAQFRSIFEALQQHRDPHSANHSDAKSLESALQAVNEKT